MRPWIGGSIEFIKTDGFLEFPTKLRLLLVNDRTVCREGPPGFQKALHAWMVRIVAVLEVLVRHLVGIVRRPTLGQVPVPAVRLGLFFWLVANEVWYLRGFMGIDHRLRIGDQDGEQRSPLRNGADAPDNAALQMVDTSALDYVTLDLQDRAVEAWMKQDKKLSELLPRQRRRSKDQPIS